MEPENSELLARYLPPHNIEAEQSVLGSMLLEGVAVEKAGEVLSPEDFYRESHQALFEALLAISARNEPVDLVTVQDELRKRDKLEIVGGIGYLTALFDAVPSAAHVEHYAKIVEEKSMLRKLIDSAMQIVGLARNPEPEQDVNDLIDQAERLIFNVSQRRMNQFFSPLSPLLLGVFDRAEELNEMKSKLSGIATGIDDFDMMTAGLQKTDFIILAARPSMGKTSFVLSVAQHVAMKEKVTVAIFSLEMSKEQLALRMVCSEAKVSGHRVRTGNLNEGEWNDLAMTVQNMYDTPIFIDDNTETSAMTMRAKCRRLAAEHGLGLIIVDYLQLMRSHRKIENRTQEIGDIARGLKSLAREMQVPVIALSQLSRAVEHRENKRPMLSDLRESGSIEAEADLVCFLYRDQYYKMKEAKEAGEIFERPTEENIEETEIIIGKHRNGPTGMVKVGFMPDYAKFVNLERNMEDGSTAF
ncbi:MAG TPA: replicative DNA helicase [Capsulimonadaceae bacterium]|jgi:replicative DNA helicase